MNSTLLQAALLSTLLMGCGRAAVQTRAEASPSSPRREVTVAASVSEEKEAPSADTTPAAEKVAARLPGDYVVHRFSGSFRDTPITLTQRIVAREGDVLVIDMTFEEGAAKQALRVRIDDSAAKRGEVVRVSRLDGSREQPAAPAALALYEELMAKTALAADQNEEILGSEAVTVAVGGSPLSAQKTSYRVRIGKRTATMQTVQADAFSWGDLSGEITAEGGDVMFRAELVEAGHDNGTKAPAIAQSDDDEDAYEE